MNEKLDEASYQEGRSAFDAGASLRSIVEQVLALDDAPTAAEAKAQDRKVMSSALGFADALLDVIRGLDKDRKSL